MSIAVPLEELAGRLTEYPWAYFTTVSGDGRVHVVAVAPDYADGAFEVAVGRTARTNIVVRPEVTMVFPPPSGTGFSLIVDGSAEIDGDRVRVVPTWAVLHRPAIAAP